MRLLPISKRKGAKNPDASVDGKKTEFKTPKVLSVDSIQKNIRKAYKQARYIVIRFTQKIEPITIAAAIKGAVRTMKKPPQRITVIIRNTPHVFTQKELSSDNLIETILWKIKK